MIFYFSGTGNTYAAALQLQHGLGGGLISITECVKNGTYSFEAAEDESVGILCPVYYGGLPSIVNEFLEKLECTGRPSYLYGVLTYGGSIFGAKEILAQKLKERGLPASAVWEVKMPANYAILYDPTQGEKAEQLLTEAEIRLEKIRQWIQERRRTDNKSSLRRMLSAIGYPMYDKARKTAPFYADESCVGCGICAGRCPVGAIEMIDGKPAWVRERCVFCMSCVRCNAIQYGKKLQGRYRYRHPVFAKKKKEVCSDCH